MVDAKDIVKSNESDSKLYEKLATDIQAFKLLYIWKQLWLNYYHNINIRIPVRDAIAAFL